MQMVAFLLMPAAGQSGHEPSLSRGICSLRSHIPCRLRRGKAATNRLSPGGFAPCGRTSPAACGGHCKRKQKSSLLRREGDSNPRNPQGVQQFSRLPRSTTPASLLQFRLQIYAEAESNANEFIQFALPRRNSICDRQAKYTQNPEANEFFQSYQNFHPGFCNVEIMTHICRKKRRRNVPRQPDSTVTFNLWFYDTDR